ncbi:uncharacterized protein LOC117327468 [Pecten maximus]|uniref:uncharacterized protein LOC117327468 n=1 Tax=Pecten maximus TaxID=6579 RepID=UPI001458612B|nr:uncharacterized protein LOC117327468 [Pecten maximus]
MGFCPSLNIIGLSFADGICIGMVTTMTWQLIVVLCPAAYVGTLAGFVYTVRSVTTALAFIAAGYILQRGNMIEKDEALKRYQYFFIMLLIVSAMGIICGIVMNVVDIRKGGAMNSRIRKWKRSDIETIGLISMADPSSSKYCGNSDAKDSDDISMNGT